MWAELLTEIIESARQSAAKAANNRDFKAFSFGWAGINFCVVPAEKVTDRSQEMFRKIAFKLTVVERDGFCVALQRETGKDQNRGVWVSEIASTKFIIERILEKLFGLQINGTVHVCFGLPESYEWQKPL